MQVEETIVIDKFLNGYKQTELGLIPNDWKVVELKDCCKLSKERVNPKSSKNNFPCIELEHIESGTGRLLGFSDTRNMKSQKSIFKEGDTLFGKLRPYLKKYFFPQFNGVCSTEIWVLKPNEEVNNKWLFYIMQTNQVIERANQSEGTKMPRADWPHVKTTPIPLPPTLTEQTAIANALSDMDALIEAQEALLAKKRAIKQGAMQELLRPKEGWKTKKLNEILASTQLGGNYQNSDKSSGPPLIKMGNIQRGYISLEKIECIASRQVNERDKLRFHDLLFNTRNTLELVGKVAIWKNELPLAYFNSNLMRMVFKDEFISSNYFMNSLFNTENVIKSLKDIATGTTSVAAIYTKDLLHLSVSIPDKMEQIRVAQILSDMDTEIEQLESQLAKYRQLKRGMMQELLTGRKRLI